MSKRPNKLAFLTQVAPSGYVPGLGRGASGFTTRSDIGPAREGPSAEVIAEAQARRGEEVEVDPEQFQDPDNETGLFAGMAYDDADEEADRIYEAVDAKMDERRKARREAREAEILATTRAERPKIQAQFADLKRGLSAVSDAEWENLPEVGNLTGKRRKLNPREGRAYVVPDSVVLGDRSKAGYENALDPMQQATGGFETPANAGGMVDIVGISQARDKVLSLKLDQASRSSVSNGTSTSIDPKGYLTSLDSVVHKTDAEIGDIKQARALLDSLVKNNRKHAPGWIAAACVEEHAGRMVAARKLIRQGCEECPKSEDVWLEAARLHNTEDAKVILANAVQHLDQSVKIWLAAAELEGDPKAKRKVLRTAVEHIPKSVRLWKEVVNMENSPEEARIILARAVEVIPQSVELWLALARLETPEKAQKVLNSARKAIPTSHEIWIAAARLMEQEAARPEKDEAARQKDYKTVDNIIASSVSNLRRNHVLLTRDQWMKEAEQCERDGSPRTCEAIIKATISMEIEEEDRYDVWKADAESALARNQVGTARAILAYALKVFPDRRALWREAADLEKEHGTRQALEELLSQAVQHCPQAETLWLMLAKEKWMGGDVPGARVVLHQAFDANLESEQIWLAAVKLEVENNELQAAKEILNRATSVAGTERIWMKAAVFERQQGNLEAALDTVNTALAKYPKFAKFYMIKGQILQSQKDIPAARATYATGVKECPKDVRLWILSSRLEEADDKRIMARALLNKARLANPNNDLLWAESVHLEERAGQPNQAKSNLARALQECPTSGLLWSMAVMAEPRPSRRNKSMDALRKLGDDPLILCTIARMFWSERSIEKARSWFARAAKADRDIGDIWAWWLKFELEHGTQEHQQQVIDQCVAAEPRHGTVWPSIAKDVANARKTTRDILFLVAKQLH
ncbi:Pre-mRNA-processing factor 6 AltName: Full=Androgen receptor N-terminal domain-transactivating protein 1; Short=ANT-1; AltName: Full=PRP6 homolog; AltName: Full=U5 snRNP-associated 102 kDa protein; Short=U5-102 kDa protein [Serendipita indica DSM 11827]|uniref:Probable pre-mRNA splicing factor prp1 n=1 Tax=Serendipita indica (strain DSM 11827) TaxID=1109443 RepID=G4TF57_SERID|nr:Pre-mRNA-processing factor 6 AltName: Full=Androgen receptor N-terminal domain-transactivating protein 1; Short=ANT-1; AltName: Full=PRP6 homolog; AltName: Full=U5 snRNP-associated 102 kDa protein; Short=U5-102 kDa protein [Serendipita indica DSM 11827]CCA69950.1 probable pre-mRNA splicing factor prp1 [Serendipita indica DSM 11827]